MRALPSDISLGGTSGSFLFSMEGAPDEAPDEASGRKRGSKPLALAMALIGTEYGLGFLVGREALEACRAWKLDVDRGPVGPAGGFQHEALRSTGDYFDMEVAVEMLPRSAASRDVDERSIVPSGTL